MSSSDADQSAPQATPFDGEEPTEVMPVPAAKTKPRPPPGPNDKQYIAPREIPAAAMPEKDDVEGAKIVLNIPEPRGGKSVADQRARRRTATVKIERRALPPAVAVPTLLARTVEDLPIVTDEQLEQTRQAKAAIARSQAEPTMPDQAAMRIPVDVDAGLLAEAGVAHDVIDEVEPISVSPNLTRDDPSFPPGRALEPPATSLHLARSRAEESSRAPRVVGGWVVGGLLVLGAAAAGAFYVTKGSAPDETTAGAAHTSTAATATAKVSSKPSVAAPSASEPPPLEVIASSDPPLSASTGSARNSGALASLPTERPATPNPAGPPNPNTTTAQRPTIPVTAPRPTTNKTSATAQARPSGMPEGL